MKRSPLVVWSLLPLLLMVCSVPVLAQQPPAGSPGPSQPPAIRFDPKGITLLDAVRLTLQHSPNIKLRETDTAMQAGALRSQTGLFDMIFNASGSFNRDQRQLLDSEREDQQQTRDDLSASVAEATRLSQSFTAAANTLSNPAVYSNPQSINWTSGISDPAVANNMSILGSQFILYNDLLKSPLLTDAKLRADIEDLRYQTLTKNTTYYVSQRDRIASFPKELSTKLANLGPTPEEQWSNQASLNFDVSKLFRSGLALRPYVDFTYDAQNYVGKDSYEEDYGGMGILPVYSGKIGFDVTFPLMRGSGSKSVAAGEIAAKYDLEASRLAILHQQSQSVFETVQAYWEMRAAADEVEVQRRSVELQGELATMTRALIAANEKPRSDEARVLASSADSRSRFEAAQRRLNDAKVNLAKVLGVAIEDALFLPVPADVFPAPPAGFDPTPQAYSDLIREAIGRRYDRQASLQSQASGKALVEGARIDTRSLLNLRGGVWGTSTHQSTANLSDWVFRSGSVGIDYQHPFGNNAARGYLEQREASLKQTEINTADLERTIALNVTQYAESLKVAATRLRLAEEAVRQYEQTIQNEQARFRSGDSSLVDTILTEQQTTNARLALVIAQQEYATLLAALRYEAGMLVQDNAVAPANLVAVPAALLKR
jgi:outer membrane protein TolC